MNEAMFVVCETCGKHGHILKADGCAGPEVAFKSAAHRLVQMGIQHGVHGLEPYEMRRQIEASEIPDGYHVGLRQLAWSIELFNRFLAEGQIPEGRDRHIYLDIIQSNSDLMQIPDDFDEVMLDNLKGGLNCSPPSFFMRLVYTPATNATSVLPGISSSNE